MTVKVCVSISAPDIPKLSSKMQQAESLAADLVEVRLDKLHSYTGLSKIARVVKCPLIATNRPVSERGSFRGTQTDRVKILQQAVSEGFEYADIEASTPELDTTMASLRENGGKIILSHHDHLRTPGLQRLDATLSHLQKYNPEVCKIVTTAQIAGDNLAILRFLQTNHRNIPLVGFAMGRAGIWSRLMAPFFGAAFTYASLGKGLETALGQPTISELRTIYQTLGLE